MFFNSLASFWNLKVLVNQSSIFFAEASSFLDSESNINNERKFYFPRAILFIRHLLQVLCLKLTNRLVITVSIGKRFGIIGVAGFMFFM